MPVALSEGMHPAEVCGRIRYPSFSSKAISLRIVAGLTPSSVISAIIWEGTGAARVMYSLTI
jgi:hypothetical protein